MRLKATVSGVALIAAATGLGVLALAMDSSVPTSVEAPVLTPDTATMALVCNGGVSRTIDAGVDAEELDENAAGWAGILASGRSERQWIPLPDDRERSVPGPVLAPDLLGETAQGQPQAHGILSVTEAGDVTRVAGATTHRADAGDLAGLANNACQWASSSMWIVGSSSELGVSNRLVVSNPGATTITVMIDGYSSIGQMDLGSNAVVNLSPRSSTEIILDGILPQDPRIALRLSAGSGRFSASLQTASLEGFTPAGLSFVPSSEFGRELTIPGLFIPAAPSEDGESSRLAHPDVTGKVRIVNPSQDPRTVDIATVVDDEETPLPGGEGVTVAPQTVLDLTLDGLEPGIHAVIVRADGDVAASVEVREGNAEDGWDTAWLAAQAPLRQGGAAFGLSQGELGLMATGSANVTWSAYDDAMDEIDSQTLVVAGTESISLPEGTSYVWIESDDDVWAAVNLRAPLENRTAVDWTPLTSGAAETQNLRIDVRP